MDVLCNGTDKEKNQFSFALMDEECNGYINFREFASYFNRVLSHWSALINTHVKLDDRKLKAIFAEIDTGKDGVIDFDEYSKALDLNPELLDWFSLLNNDTVHDKDSPQPKKSPEAAKPKNKKKEKPRQTEVVMEERASLIDKENIDKIVALHAENKTKDEVVQSLQTEIQTFQETTAD